MRFEDLDIGELFRWQGTTWEKHRAAHARINVNYPRARNNEVHFPQDREVRPVEPDDQ